MIAGHPIFPDYDNINQFNAIRVALEAAGLKVEDGSWKNDTCPKVVVNGRYDVMVEYKDPALRESGADAAETFFLWDWDDADMETNVTFQTVEQVVEWFRANGVAA